MPTTRSVTTGRFIPFAIHDGKVIYFYRDLDQLGSGLNFLLDTRELPWVKMDSTETLRYDHGLQMSTWYMRGEYRRTPKGNHGFIPDAKGSHILYCNAWGTLDNGEFYPGHVLASKPGALYQHRATSDQGDFGFDYVVRPYVWPAPID